MGKEEFRIAAVLKPVTAPCPDGVNRPPTPMGFNPEQSLSFPEKGKREPCKVWLGRTSAEHGLSITVKHGDGEWGEGDKN